MDQKTSNRLVVSIIIVPMLLFIMYLVVNRIISVIVYHLINKLNESSLKIIIYVKSACMIGIAAWMIVFAYVFIRYGDFKLDHLFSDKNAPRKKNNKNV